MFAEGETIVHQGLSGSGFFVIVDGEARSKPTAVSWLDCQRGDFFGEVAILIGVPAIADVVATRQMRCLVLPGPTLESFLISHPEGRCSACSSPGAPAPGGESMADVTESARPFPPGAYPVVVIGSGPGGLQVSYSLRRHGIAARGHLCGPLARRHVPPLAVLPAPAVVDQAPCPGAAGVAGVRALRLEQPPRR